MPKLLEGYDPKDIFNCDEFGLFYKMMPKRSLSYKGKQCKGGKLSKERVTGFMCTNMDGSEKEKLVIIGKYANPRCFKNVKSLPIKYYNNSTAWMNTKIFRDIVTNFNKRMMKERRKVLLFSDNCSSHKLSDNFSNVKLIFLPANTTSVLQPLDQGIIHSFKSKYRAKLAQQFLEIIRAAKSKPDFNPLTFKIEFNLKDAVNLASYSWDCVTEETIKNCFTKCGFGSNIEISNEVISFEENEVEFSELCAELGETILFEDYVICDDSLKTTFIYRESEECLHTENNYNEETEIDSGESDYEFESEIIETIPTTSEVLDMVKKINNYFMSRESVSDNAFKLVNNLKQEVYET